MFLLESRQASPRTIVIILPEEEARHLGTCTGSVLNGLNLLKDLDYIDGPGAESDGHWFFRKLTRKGADFVRITRRPDEWEIIKYKNALLTKLAEPGSQA
jgi:hypothetical protein